GDAIWRRGRTLADGGAAVRGGDQRETGPLRRWVLSGDHRVAGLCGPSRVLPGQRRTAGPRDASRVDEGRHGRRRRVLAAWPARAVRRRLLDCRCEESSAPRQGWAV